MEFGSILKKLRNKKGLTLTELGNEMGYSNPYLSQIETGKKGIPSPEMLRKYAKSFGVDSTYLMFLAGYLFDTDFSEEKELELKEKFERHLIETDLSDLLNSDSDLYYKDRLLTKEEKEKLLTIIETILN